MGQAMRKLESFYRKVESGNKISGKLHGNSIENSHIYNNLDNDDYDYKRVLITKSNAIKMYLDRNKIENIEEVENLTIRLVEKVENKYLSVEEAANYLDCTTKTIRNRIKAGMPYETDKNKYMISIENLEKWRHGKPDGVEIPLVEEIEELEQDIETEVETVDNSNDAEYIPSVVENFVTREELNAYTSAINNFTTTLAEIKHQQELERQENKIVIDTLANENAQLVKKVEHLISRVSRVDEFIEHWRSEKKLSWWRKLFNVFPRQ